MKLTTGSKHKIFNGFDKFIYKYKEVRTIMIKPPDVSIISFMEKIKDQKLSYNNFCKALNIPKAEINTSFNPHTHELRLTMLLVLFLRLLAFNPRTHVSCDKVTKPVKLMVSLSIHAHT